jgi:hypothetical protein
MKVNSLLKTNEGIPLYFKYPYYPQNCSTICNYLVALYSYIKQLIRIQIVGF